MKPWVWRFGTPSVVLAVVGLVAVGLAKGQPPQPPGGGGTRGDSKEDFPAVVKRMSAAKPGVMKKQMDLLNERYDLSDRPAKGVTMTRGKPVQAGARTKLPSGLSWAQLGGMSADEI